MQELLNKLIKQYRGCGMKAEYEGTKSFYEAASCHYWNSRSKCVKRGHQRKHLSNALLYQFADILVGKQQELEACSKYEDLKKIVDDSKIKGIGPVTLYDAATAIGYLQSPKVLPEQFVYLHAGVRKGYNALVKANLLPNCRENKVATDVFDCLNGLQSEELKKYIPKEATFSMIVEDFLCVMHEELEKL